MKLACRLQKMSGGILSNFFGRNLLLFKFAYKKKISNSADVAETIKITSVYW